jgi:hypothetical protein
MALLSIDVNVPGMTGVVPSIIYIQTSDPLATVTQAGYVNQFVQREGFNLNATQSAWVSTSDSGNILCNVQVSSTGVITLLPTLPGRSSLLLAKGSISSAQVLNGGAAFSVQVIPAPGANNLIICAQAMFSLVFGTIQYANGAASQFEYGDGSHTNVFGTQVLAATINANANRDQILVGVAQAANAGTFVNQAVNFVDTGAAFINGNGTLRYAIWYSIVSVI